MSNYEALRLVVYAIGLPIIFYLCMTAARKMRAIRELDLRLKKEAEQNAQNPYAQMAQLLEAQELLSRAGKKNVTPRLAKATEDDEKWERVAKR